MIYVSREVGVNEMLGLCQRVLDGKGMAEDWKTNVLVPILKGKADVRNCNTYRGVKLLEHAVEIVERVLEGRIRELVNIDSMQFAFTPGKGTTDALFVVQRIQEEYRDKKKKLYMYYVDTEKAFNRAPRKVMEWAITKKDLPEVICKNDDDLYNEANTKVQGI